MVGKSPSCSLFFPVPLLPYLGSSVCCMADYCQLEAGSVPLFKVNFINTVLACHSKIKYPENFPTFVINKKEKFLTLT